MKTMLHVKRLALLLLPIVLCLRAFAQGTTFSYQGSLSENNQPATDGTIIAADLDTTSFGTTFWRAAGNLGTDPVVNFLVPPIFCNQGRETFLNGA